MEEIGHGLGRVHVESLLVTDEEPFLDMFSGKFITPPITPLTAGPSGNCGTGRDFTLNAVETPFFSDRVFPSVPWPVTYASKHNIRLDDNFELEKVTLQIR